MQFIYPGLVLHQHQQPIIIMSTEQCAEITLKTEQVGDFKVTIQEKGESKKLGSLVTIHDIGLNSTSYLDFFNNEHNLQVSCGFSPTALIRWT